MHVVISVDQQSGALIAVNRYSEEFRSRVAFLDTDDEGRAVSGDRMEFIGRNGSLRAPFVMQRINLSGKVGAGFDPCGAMQVRLALDPGQAREVVFRLGAGKDIEQARSLIAQCRGIEAARKTLKAAKDFWRQTLGAVQIETPDPAFNLLANGWLLYQTLSCRFWGRNAEYQSGGAFGFRDQLQDSLALLYARPDLTRKHLVLCASKQFVEGDAMHWWHPPGGRGVRTRCSDDYLWLPYAVERYIAVTGDSSVLDEKAAYIEGRQLKDEEESYYDLPRISAKAESLYEHCRKAVEYGLKFGLHGLPLMGSGDWNDGMDLVGIKGCGESVWLGFFLYTVLTRFAGLADARGETDFARRCRDEAAGLQRNIEINGWDDTWYRRAYFDDGAPLGSVANQECRIDSICQSWAALSGAGDPKHVASGLRSLDKRLVDRDGKIIKLFEPPFDKSDLNPGYIKGYVPGVRENGGQYTHAAVWAAMAFAKQGDADKAWNLLSIVNPINHAATTENAKIYMVEPYVIAADVYAAAQRVGRGGWSWYTGSASWFYVLLLESILGFTLRDSALRINPCVPASWKGFTLTFAHGQSRYRLSVECANARVRNQAMLVDGRKQQGDSLSLPDDGNEHTIVIGVD